LSTTVVNIDGVTVTNGLPFAEEPGRERPGQEWLRPFRGLARRLLPNFVKKDLG
jgi:hypothetical protein